MKFCSLKRKIFKEFETPYPDKDFFLKSLASYKKQNNSDASSYANENFIQTNFKILRAAIHLKKNKVLSSAFTMGGCVYIRKQMNEDTILFEAWTRYFRGILFNCLTYFLIIINLMMFNFNLYFVSHLYVLVLLLYLKVPNYHNWSCLPSFWLDCQ